MMYRNRWFTNHDDLFFVFVSLLLCACGNSQKNALPDLNDLISEHEVSQIIPNHITADTYQFSFELRSSPQEDARQYVPFVKYLEETTGYKFNIYFTPDNSSIIDELGNNNVQFAAIGASKLLEAQDRYNITPIVRGINSQGKAAYRSAFIVDKDSSIKSILELKDKYFAFGGRSSTQGHLIPRIILAENGIALDDLAAYIYTGSHRNCVGSVIAKKTDACALQDTMAINMAQRGLVKIIYTSRFFPSSCIAVNQEVPIEVINKVKQALLDFDPQGEDKQNLYNWNNTEMPLGFVEAKSGDYAELLDWSIKLGLLKNSNN